MSYILDALRKSEAERRQGKVPDLGQQVQLIHRPGKKPLSAVVWIAIALVINAVVLAVIFWPGAAQLVPAPEVTGSAQVSGQTSSDDSVPESPAREAVDEGPDALAQSGLSESLPQQEERPTLIVPAAPIPDDQQVVPDYPDTGRIPHLVELPLSFQKSVPDLTFNSHIYSSSRSARRVMINNRNLRVGDRFSGLVVEDITEEGVVLSKSGQRFRVGIVRDWVSPR